jgi:hypothetical protein
MFVIYCVNFTGLKHNIMKKYPLYILVIILITGCYTTSPIVQRIPYPEKEYASLPGTTSGNSSVKGEAFFVSSWGDPKKCVGATIYLFPVTSYSRQWYNEFIVKGHKMNDWDPRSTAYDVIAKAGADGKFEFYNIAEGEYYLYTYFVWDAPQINTYGNIIGTKKSGGHLISQVSVKSGMNYTVMLTNK